MSVGRDQKGLRKHQKGRWGISGGAGVAPNSGPSQQQRDLPRGPTAGETASNGTATMCLCSSQAAAYVWQTTSKSYLKAVYQCLLVTVDHTPLLLQQPAESASLLNQVLISCATSHKLPTLSVHLLPSWKMKISFLHSLGRRSLLAQCLILKNSMS